jgi:cytochrome c oxidase assembly factor 6
MAWSPFGGSSDDSGVKKTSGGAFEKPSRTNRAKCYEARDAFFECLDRNNILDSINSKAGRAATQTACAPSDQAFEKNCAHSWVRHLPNQFLHSGFITGTDMGLQVEYFKKQRVVNYQKEQTIKKIEAEGGEIIAPQLPLKK